MKAFKFVNRHLSASGVLCAALAVSLSLPAGATGYRETRVASDVAEVVDSQPIYRSVEVPVPREVCRDERVRQTGWQSADHEYRYEERTRRSHTPGIVGAIIGGAIGHKVGSGKKNKKIGTAVGAILGGSIGGDISRRRHEQAKRVAHQHSRGDERPVSYRTERVCREQVDYRTEQQISGWDVTYVYAGETYTTVLDEDPGRYLDVRVRVTPVPS